MPIYTPITDVMPVASMVTGAVVSSALCDQIRDDLVALYNGWWFRATGPSVAIGAAVATAVPVTSMTMSDTVAADGSVTVANGVVTVSKAGLWLYVGHLSVSSDSGLFGVIVDAASTPGPGAQLAMHLNDTANTKTDSCASGTTHVTTTDTVALLAYSAAGNTIQLNDRSPILSGVWLGESP